MPAHASLVPARPSPARYCRWAGKPASQGRDRRCRASRPRGPYQGIDAPARCRTSGRRLRAVERRPGQRARSRPAPTPARYAAALGALWVWAHSDHSSAPSCLGNVYSTRTLDTRSALGGAITVLPLLLTLGPDTLLGALLEDAHQNAVACCQHARSGGEIVARLLEEEH